LGNPLIPRYAEHLRPRRVLFKDAQPLPFNTFSMNQIANMFGVRFSNGHVMGKPSFARNHPVSVGMDTTFLSFDQSLSPLLCKNRGIKTLVYANGKPVAVSLSYGKGRVGICAAPGLFMQYGRLRDRILGNTDHIISVQKELLMRWLRWLAENSPVRRVSPSGYQISVVPEIKLSGNNAEVYCIPPLRTVASDLLAKWELIWEDFSEHTGLESPLDFVPAAKPGDKLQIYLRSATAGGLAAGTRVSVPGAGEESAMISVLGHEVGHKFLLGWNVATAEAIAEWFAIRALRATGHRDLAEHKIQTFRADFAKADPSRKAVDVSIDPKDIRLSQATGPKWFWIMTQLCEKYGDDTIEKYIASIHRNNRMFNQYLKFDGNKRIPLTFEDHVAALCDATGEDLRPWFRSIGTTLK